MNETPVQAVIRETYEETRVALDPGRIHPYFNAGFANINELHIGFRCELDSDCAASPGEESLEVGFFTAEQIRGMQLAFAEQVGDYTAVFFQHLLEGRFGFMSAQVTGRAEHPTIAYRTYWFVSDEFATAERK